MKKHLLLSKSLKDQSIHLRYVLLFSCIIYMALAWLICTDIYAENAKRSYNYNYNAVCRLIGSQISIAEKLINTDDRQHIVSLPVKNKNNAWLIYRYSYQGISIDYIQTQDKKVISSVNFKANTFPDSLRLKSSILSQLGVIDISKISSKVSFGCDSRTLELRFKGEDLEGVTIYAFID
jgi:hypothetical protein